MRIRSFSSEGRRETRGFSLIELMVALTLGLLILLAMSTLLAQQSRTREQLAQTAGQIENGRYALMLLRDDFQHAGFYGEFGNPLTLPSALPNPCATATADIRASLALPIQGYNAETTVPSPLSGCLANDNHVPGTDIVVLRRVQANDVLPTLGTLTAGRVYVQATPDNLVVDTGAAGTDLTLLQKDGATPARIRAYVQHIYFISPCNVYASGTTCTAAADNGSPIPTLKRLEISAAGGATVFTTTPLVEGIEDMQFDYGLDVDGAGAPSTPFIVAPTLAQWPDVMAVGITLRARNIAASPGYIDGKIYDMGVAGTVPPFSDGFRRHVYAENVRLINPSSRRE